MRSLGAIHGHVVQTTVIRSLVPSTHQAAPYQCRNSIGQENPLIARNLQRRLAVSILGGVLVNSCFSAGPPPSPQALAGEGRPPIAKPRNLWGRKVHRRH
jgi:hypothetical protein